MNALTITASPADAAREIARRITARVSVETLYEAALRGNDDTVRAYAADWNHFACHVESVDGHPCPDGLEALRVMCLLPAPAANQVVDGYVKAMSADGYAPATINRRLGAIRSMLRQASKFGLIQWELAVDNVKHEAYRDTRGPEHEDFLAAVAACLAGSGPEHQRQRPIDVRDYAILRILHDVGLRRMEVANLNRDDVDLRGRRVRIRGKGRGDKEFVTLPPPTLDAVGRWLDLRGDGPGPLFRNMDRANQNPHADRRLDEGSYLRVVKRWAERAGLDLGRFSPHKLRHAGATRVAQKTGDAIAVQAWLRHKSLDTAQIYIDHAKDLAGQAAAVAAED